MTKTIRRILLTAIALCTVLSLACIVESARPLPAASDEPTSAPVAATDEPRQIETQMVTLTPAEPQVTDEQKQELNAILRRATFLKGVTIGGVAVGDMTMQEAREALAEPIAAAKKSFTVYINDTVSPWNEPEALTGERLPVIDDIEDVLQEAFNIVREDKGYDAVMQEVALIAEKGQDFKVTLSFDESAIGPYVNTYSDAHDRAPVDASFSYDEEQKKIVFADDQKGAVIDREELKALLAKAQNGELVEAPVIEQQADVTREVLEQSVVRRSTFTTNFKGSKKNRIFNIKKGVGMIMSDGNNTLKPGQVFSMNDTIGVRTYKNGWKAAGAYANGEVIEEAGGGVCQLSSTLYNAAVLADMKIVFRQNHSMPVGYVDKGLDATINSTGKGKIDFKFENSSKADIIIVAYTDGYDLTFEIWGIPISEDCNGEYDRIVVPTPKKIKPLYPNKEIEYQVDESLKPGQTKKIVGRRNGSVWESVKQYYLGETFIKEEPLATSTYKAFAGLYAIGPDKSSSDDPGKSDDPKESPKPDNPSNPPDNPSEPDNPPSNPEPDNPPSNPEPDNPPSNPEPDNPPAPSNPGEGEED